MKCNPAFGLHSNSATYVREGGVGIIYSSLASRKTQCSNFSWIHKEEVKKNFYFSKIKNTLKMQEFTVV